MFSLMDWFLSDCCYSDYPVRTNRDNEVLYTASCPGLDTLEAQLEGKTLHLSGKRGTREVKVDWVLPEKDLDDLTVEYYRGEIRVHIPKKVVVTKSRDISVDIKG